MQPDWPRGSWGAFRRVAGPVARPDPPKGARNLVIVTLDSLRFDTCVEAKPTTMTRLGEIASNRPTTAITRHSGTVRPNPSEYCWANRRETRLAVTDS